MKPPRIFVALAATISVLPTALLAGTITGTTGGNDTWNVASNWSPAAVPSGTAGAVIGSGVIAKVDNGSTPGFSGGLLLDTNAQLQIGWTTVHAANVNALGSGPIVMRQGSQLISRAGLGTYTFTQPFAMEGDGIIWAGISTANHGTTKTFAAPLSGAGKLIYNGVNNTTFVFAVASPSWSGGIQTSDPQNQTHKLSASANGCFGTGDVAINNNCSLEIAAGLGDVIGDGAALSFTGVKSSPLAAKLVLGSDEVVRSLHVNGVQLNAGFYNASSGLLDAGGNPLISGSGALLVLESPGTGSQMAIISTTPGDNASNGRATDPLVVYFSKPLVALAGAITLRNLTDSVDTPFAVNGPAVTISGYSLTLDAGAALQWNKSYAVHIAAGALEGTTGVPFPGIADNTGWNFTTYPNAPLLTAVQGIKNHVTGAVTLSGAQIAAHKATIDAEKERFDENVDNITAVFDLIKTYDTLKGPLFVSGSTVTDFSRNNTNPADKKSVSDENVHWVVYTVMQHIMDVIYNAETLADPAKRAVIANFNNPGGYKFGSIANFPGPCAPPANPLNAHTVAINGSFDDTFGRATQQWTLPARKPTGTYLAPGTIATVTVPPALVGQGYQVRVGAHSWNLANRPPVKRLERATLVYDLDAASIEVASPYGGGIYIEVPLGADAGVVNVTITGAVRSPYFSWKSFHQTTPAEWLVERAHPAPWADFQSEKFMTQVPSKWIYNHPDPAQLMTDWDKAMDAINSLMGFPLDRGKETMYCQTDVILRSSVHAPGYPAVNVSTSVTAEVSPPGYAGNYLVRGPGASPTAAHIEFHEQGHAYFFPKFGGESESNVNLLQPAMLQREFGYSFDVAQAGSLGSGSLARSMDNTAVAWMCVFNFSPREVPMASGEKAYQHKGHAKFMDLARLFGWEGLDDYWRSFMEDDANNISYGTGTDDLLLRLSRNVGRDIRPLFHFWGIHPENPETLAAAIAAENIPASVEIRDQLLRYKTLVPADNAAFRAFALAWWGKQPSINGFWEEREHARQWDTTPLYGVGDQQRSEATNPGEIYNANSANDITNRVQELIDLYFPSAINPNPMTFAVQPAAVNATTIGMVATSATAAIGPIMYYFDETSGNPGGNDSKWQASPGYQDTGLTAGLTYSYTVTARDGLANLTDPSAALSAVAQTDTTAPAPSPMSFSSPPSAVDEFSITMTASTATDINGVEYEFESISGGGNNSGWQAGPIFIDTGLSPSTEYGYRVRARDSLGNSTGWSAPALANTADLPDTAPPLVLALNPTGPVTAVATNLVVTFDEPVVAGSGFVTLRNLTEGTQSQISINDGAQVTVSGAVLTINPAADLLLNRTYAVRIDSGAVADVSSNPFTGITDDFTWTFHVIIENPLADAGGPYTARTPDGFLLLDGSGSLPSSGATITAYEWDIDNDSVFGDVTGAVPAAISSADLLGVWDMVLGENTIQLRVTDSASRTATVSGTVSLTALPVPVAYWPMRDGLAGSNVTGANDVVDDATHPATDATASGTATSKWAADPDRGVVYSTVENSRLTAGQQGISAGNPFTWSLWVKTSDTTAFYEFPGDDNAPSVIMGTRSGTYLKLQPDGLSSSWNASVGGFNTADGSWRHMAVVGTGSAISVYVDGISVGTDSSLGTPLATTLLEIGGASNFTEDLTGLISDVAIWNAALTPAQIGDLANGASVVTDATAPILAATTPQDNSPEGGVNTLRAILNEPVVIGTGDIRIVNDTDSVTTTIAVSDASQVTVSGASIIISPASPLIGGKAYHIEMDAGLVKNAANLAFGGILDASTWNFTADNLPPTLVSMQDPYNGATFGEDLDTLTYTVTFNEAIDGTTVEAVDFNNAGTAAVTIGAVTQTAPATFSVVVRPDSAGTLQLRIPVGSAIADTSGNLLLAPVLDNTVITIIPGLTPGITISGTTVSPAGNGDTWGTPGNWSGGFTPVDVWPAIVAAGVTARADSTLTRSYAGGLIVEAGSTIRIGGGGGSSARTESRFALGTGPVTLKAGSQILWQLAYSNYQFPPLVLNGNATVTMSSNEAHNRTYVYGAVSGAGKLTISGTNNNDHRFVTANPGWSGGLVIEQNSNQRTTVEGDAAGCFGTGDVTSRNWTTLQIDVAGVIDDGAALFLHGNRRDNEASKLILNASETVDEFWVDQTVGDGTGSVQLAAGNYTSTSGLLDLLGNPLITGPGVLTVLSGPATGDPEIAVEQPALVDITSGGSRIFGTVTVGANASLIFLIRNAGTADLVLGGDPRVSVGGTNASEFVVTVSPETPVAPGDDTTFTVRFAPGAPGPRSAVLSIANNDGGGNPFTINLSGTGQTPYQAWSFGADFGIDSNLDGVDNGMAWLLGASNKDVSALGKVPVASMDDGKVVLDFTCLKVANRGGAVLKVQFSNDLGLTDPWSGHEAVVPDTNATVNGVVFVTSANADPALVNVQATIPASLATQLFARLAGVGP